MFFHFSAAEDHHDETADERHRHDEGFQHRQRCQMRYLGTEPCTDHQPQQCLDENRENQMTIEKIAEATCCRDGQDDHHACADRLYQRQAKDDHECQLDICRRTDAECSGQEPRENADRNAAAVERRTRQYRAPRREMGIKPFHMIEFQITRV